MRLPILALTVVALSSCSLATDFDFQFRAPQVDGPPQGHDAGEGDAGTDNKDDAGDTDGGGDGDQGPHDDAGEPPDPRCMNAACAAEATCSIVDEKPVCTCERGYYDLEGDGTRCIDLNECSAGLFECQEHASCVNSPGAYECVCDNGYLPNASTDECLDSCLVLMSTTCDAEGGICTKPDGNATCRCKAGYIDVKGDGSECREDAQCTSLNCHEYATCDSSDGPPECVCPAGFSGNGTLCEDVDECTMGTHDCDAKANCTNTLGGFACSCQDGWSGTGRKGVNGEPGCTDINECTTNAHNCNALATCKNTAGSYTCVCPSGYGGTGVGPTGCCMPDGANTDASHPNDGKDNDCNGFIDRAMLGDTFPLAGQATHAGDVLIAIVPSQVPNATLECRHFKRSQTVNFPDFTGCKNPATHPADPRDAKSDGAWHSEFRWKFPNGATSEIVAHDYYLHHSIAGIRYLAKKDDKPTPRCPGHAVKESALFAAAEAKLQASLIGKNPSGTALTDPGVFASPTHLVNPFIRLAFNPLTGGQFSLRKLAQSVPVAAKTNPSFAADIMSLRHSFVRSPNGRYILIRRNYPSRTRYDDTGASDCSAMTFVYSLSHWQSKAAKAKVSCDAVVVNRAGVGVCLAVASGKITYAWPHTSQVSNNGSDPSFNPQNFGYGDANKFMWRHLIDERGWHRKLPGVARDQTGFRHFSEKCDTASCASDDPNELYLPDRAIVGPK